MQWKPLGARSMSAGVDFPRRATLQRVELPTPLEINMPVVHDMDRPDVNGVLPKMNDICEKTKTALEGSLPWLRIDTNDNIMSSVTIRGTKEPKDQWINGIFHNARYFIISIVPPDGDRYYTGQDTVTVKLDSVGFRDVKFRKYTGPVEKVIAKIKEFIAKM